LLCEPLPGAFPGGQRPSSSRTRCRVEKGHVQTTDRTLRRFGIAMISSSSMGREFFHAHNWARREWSITERWPRSIGKTHSLGKVELNRLQRSDHAGALVNRQELLDPCLADRGNDLFGGRFHPESEPLFPHHSKGFRCSWMPSNQSCASYPFDPSRRDLHSPPSPAGPCTMSRKAKHSGCHIANQACCICFH